MSANVSLKRVVDFESVEGSGGGGVGRWEDEGGEGRRGGPLRNF